MYSFILEELKNWKKELESSRLNEYDITVANIILKDYEQLINAGGRASGKRISKFVELLNQRQKKLDKQLLMITTTNSASNLKIKRIKRLEVDSFRGFAVSRVFDLDKQYVLLYGPNGSGKTSFSEALEYALLGSIQEADSNKIKLNQYIKNASTKKGKDPIVACVYEDGQEGIVKPSFDEYRFAFIEKNRISDFSHISALNAKSQSDRIAALFGLSEFSLFVQEFTERIEEKYLPLTSKTEDEYNRKKISRDFKEEQLNKLTSEQDEISKQIDVAIARLNCAEITTIEQAISFFSDPKTGKLTIAIAERDKKYIKPIDRELFSELLKKASIINHNLETIHNGRQQLASMAMEVNFQQLYHAIDSIERTDICPACGTPLAMVSHDPFTYAHEQLESLSQIDSIKQLIIDNSKSVFTETVSMHEFFSSTPELFSVLGINTIGLCILAADEAQNEDQKADIWIKFCKDVLSISQEMADKIIGEYNNVAIVANKVLDENVSELEKQRMFYSELKTKRDDKSGIIEQYKKEIDDFDRENEATLARIKEEKESVSFNKEIMKAYESIVENLKDYNSKLPGRIANDLEERIVNYYNTINQDDAEFEKIKSISLPKDGSEKMMIVFCDNTVAEALQVLSEGHIKILGLSILLARAVHDDLHFIIFDDIVNAIDDDHRNGVADLIANHQDFQNKQIILSTHGDQFVLKLKDKLGQTKEKGSTVVYKFLPADSLEERGIIVEYSDAKTPLLAARNKLDAYDLKDSASKCRQALECILYNLWNTISKTQNVMISVGMRNPKALPDLSSITDGLLKKCKKMQGFESIVNELSAIKDPGNWRILNKGTHYEDEQKEFERSDVKRVIEHLEKLNDLVSTLRITAVGVQTN